MKSIYFHYGSFLVQTWECHYNQKVVAQMFSLSGQHWKNRICFRAYSFGLFHCFNHFFIVIFSAEKMTRDSV